MIRLDHQPDSNLIRIIIALAVFAATMIGVAALTTEDAGATHGGAHCKVILHRGLTAGGLENQLAGVTYGGEWGWAEVDADITADGRVIGFHDATVGRLTGGDLSGYLDEHTLAALNATSHPFGQFRLTTSLIGRAARDDVPLMVTMNRHGRHAPEQRAALVDELYAAAQQHPRPHLIYFGGAGYRELMSTRHPDAATFHRYDNHDIQEDIFAHVTDEGIDLAALPTGYFQGEIVQKVRDAGASRVATRQILAKRDAVAAQRAGISTVQGNDPVQVATRWCE
jgi:glycerophosphoryl diester phosphodiesterase